MPKFVGVGGIWEEQESGSAVGVGGTYRTIEGEWVGVGGVWRKYYDRATITVSPQNVFDVTGSISTATITYLNDGTVFENTVSGGSSQLSASTDWVIPNDQAPGLFEIRMTVNSGATPIGAATGTWLPLTISRSWTITQNGLGTDSALTTIEIREDGGAVLDSGAVSLTAQVV